MGLASVHKHESAAYQAARKLVDEQAADDGLWFIATTAPEAYLQQELRRLHAVIENKSMVQCVKDLMAQRN